jgi:hypothetical protein
MSSRAQRTIQVRTSLSQESGLLLTVANLSIGAAQLAFDSVARIQVPRMTGCCGGRWSARIGVAHPLPAFVSGERSQRQDRQYKSFCCPVALASCATSLQQGRFHRAPSLPYFPCFPSVTRFGAYPAPGGLAVLLRCALRVSAFRKSFRPFRKKRGKKRFSEPSEKARLRPWERGTLASLRARVSRGNFGQIQTGEKQWHSTKTKSR